MSPISLGFWAVAGAGGAAAGAYELISSTILGSDTASITFSSIVSTYKHLQIRYTARASQASTTWTAIMNFNGDTATNYSNHLLYAYNGSVPSEGYANQTYINFGNVIPGSTGAANTFAGGIVEILDYANTGKNKTTRTLNGSYGTSGTTSTVELNSGNWRNTAAISSITLKPYSTANFVTGSRFSLYGIKG